MNSRERELALRKQLLLARSSLCRLRVRHQAGIVRDRLSWRQAGALAASSPAGRTAGFLLALAIVGRERMARILSFAGRALAVARVAAFAAEWLRAPRGDPPGGQQP